MRTEGYGPAQLDDDARQQRQRWATAAVPPIAVVTRSCQLDWNAPFFTNAEQRPVVITAASAAPDDRTRAAEVADARGHENVLAEDGPGIDRPGFTVPERRSGAAN